MAPRRLSILSFSKAHACSGRPSWGMRQHMATPASCCSAQISEPFQRLAMVQNWPSNADAQQAKPNTWQGPCWLCCHLGPALQAGATLAALCLLLCVTLHSCTSLEKAQHCVGIALYVLHHGLTAAHAGEGVLPDLSLSDLYMAVRELYREAYAVETSSRFCKAGVTPLRPCRQLISGDLFRI